MMAKRPLPAYSRVHPSIKNLLVIQAPVSLTGGLKGATLLGMAWPEREKPPRFRDGFYR